MKHALIIALLMAAGCEDPSRSSPKPESPKSEYILPNGSSLYCQNHRVWDTQMDLEECESAHLTAKRILCAHGVCWEEK